MKGARALGIALADRLDDILTPEWRDALLFTPRHMFVPDRGWRVADGSETRIPIDRESDPDAWLDAAYSDDIILTHAPEDGDGPSSCSLPYMVMTMLEHLDVQANDKVLEIGTGTGWTSALLASYLRGGERNVYTVEVDRQVAEAALANLRKMGLVRIQTKIGDGTLGYPSGAQFDRILATCTVHTVPPPWLAQSRPGGIILTPWGTALHNGALLKLIVDEVGTGCGRFVHSSAFMWLRAQQFTAPDEPDGFADIADRSTADPEAASLLFNEDAMFTAGILVPQCRISFDRNEDGDAKRVWLLGRDSWAAISSDGAVRQLGTRRLWDEVTSAHQAWAANSRPGSGRYGVTVTPIEQTVWLDEPSNVVSKD